MSLITAIGRGALDIAHGVIDYFGENFARLADRVINKLGISLTGQELIELADLTTSSRKAVEELWEDKLNDINIPVADVPVYGDIGKYQTKVISQANDSAGGKLGKIPFYFEDDDLLDRQTIEEYISEFWRNIREQGADKYVEAMTGVDFINVGNIRNIPIYSVKRS